MYGIHIPDKVRFMSITDKVRYIRITDKVRYTRNTNFVYNGQKNAGPNWYVIREVYCTLPGMKNKNSSVGPPRGIDPMTHRSHLITGEQLSSTVGTKNVFLNDASIR